MVHPATTSSTPLGEVDAAPRMGDHVAWLSDVLQVTAVEAIGHGPAGSRDTSLVAPAGARWPDDERRRAELGYD